MTRSWLSVVALLSGLSLCGCGAPEAQRGDDAEAIVGQLKMRDRTIDLTAEAFDRAAERHAGEGSEADEDRGDALDLREMRARQVMADVAPERARDR